MAHGGPIYSAVLLHGLRSEPGPQNWEKYISETKQDRGRTLQCYIMLDLQPSFCAAGSCSYQYILDGTFEP